MLPATVLGILFHASAAALPPVAPPPQPDFRNPVDYVAWYDEAVEHAKADNAFDAYGVFLYGKNRKDADKLAPISGSQAERGIERLTKSPQLWYPKDERGLDFWASNLENRYYRAFKSAGKRKYFAVPRSPDLKLLLDLQPPALANGRLIGKMMFVRAWRVTDNTLYGNRLPEAIETNLVFANHVAQGMTLEEQFFAIGHHAYVYDQLERSLSSPLHMHNYWVDVVEVLETHDAESITRAYARSLYFAEASALQLLQDFCTITDDSGKSRLEPKVRPEKISAYLDRKYGDSRLKPRNANALASANPVALARAIHDYYAKMRALLDQDYVVDLKQKLDALDAEMLAVNPGMTVLVTPIGISVKSAFRTEAERRLARLFLKMTLPFKLTGEWPQSLDEIEGPGIAECRVDPFTGKDVLLRAANSGVKVPYSVGINGQDDGGDLDADVVFWGMVAPEAHYHRGKQAKTQPTTQPATQPAEKDPGSKP